MELRDFGRYVPRLTAICEFPAALPRWAQSDFGLRVWGYLGMKTSDHIRLVGVRQEF